MVEVQLTGNIHFSHRNDSLRSSIKSCFPDGYENSAAIQDFLQELIVDAKVRPFELPTSALHQLLLLEVLEFSHSGSQVVGVGLLPSQVVNPMEGDFLDGVG